MPWTWPPLIKQTIDIATTLDDKVEKKEITLEEALGSAPALEESGVEAYVQKVMLGKTNHESLNYVKQFSKDCEFHAELIREFRDILAMRKTGERPVSPESTLKFNCWEFNRCGRQPGGEHEHDAGLCPAAVEARLDGIHGGLNAGRTCWVVAGTSCKGAARGTNVQKLKNCRICDFYLKVREEERSSFKCSAELLSRLEPA